MESGWIWEQSKLISEHMQGMELAKQLRLHLNAKSSVETRDFLVERILTSYAKALLILNWRGSMEQLHPEGATVTVPESPLCMNGSPRTEDFEWGIERPSRKRTTLRWTDQVRVSFENLLEVPNEDVYGWRKYEQKYILGAKCPRSYYRCTYRNTQNCWATKQVKRSDEDPTVFEVTYRRTHTCITGQQSVPPPPSPEKHEMDNNNQNHPQERSQEVHHNFPQGLGTKTEDLANKEMASPFTFSSAYGSWGSSSPSFISQPIPEPNPTLFPHLNLEGLNICIP